MDTNHSSSIINISMARKRSHDEAGTATSADDDIVSSNNSNSNNSNNGSEDRPTKPTPPVDNNNKPSLTRTRPRTTRTRNWFASHLASTSKHLPLSKVSSSSSLSKLASNKESAGQQNLPNNINIDTTNISSNASATPTLNNHPKEVSQIRLHNVKQPTATSSNIYLPTIIHQQPTINIMSNPYFGQLSRKSSSTEQRQAAATSTAVDTPTTTPKENKKPKKSTTSLSSSLRRLLTINFRRNNNNSSSSSTLNSNNNNTISPNNQPMSEEISGIDQFGSKSGIKHRGDKVSSSTTATTTSCKGFGGGGKRGPFTPRRTSGSVSSSGIQSILVSNHLVAHQEGIVRNEKRSLSQPHASVGGTDKAILTNTTRRQTISESDKLAKSDKQLQTTSPTSTTKEAPTNGSWCPAANVDIAEIDGSTYFECPLCVLLVNESATSLLESCQHRVCLDCMQRYITIEINHSRLNITCPICSEPIHPNTIKQILQNEKYYLKYETFMLRRVLAAEPDARWCPAPDCGYAVLANGCASCPKLVCGREGCNTSFCYHCKQEWHPNQTCNAAGIQRNKRIVNVHNIADLIEESNQSNRKSSKSSQRATIRADDIKECPVCASRIIKMNDGSCNHMTCSICETEFCWLCMKEISDLHYFSPSGCTFWGKKPWSRKKKLLWQLGMLVGAPICIILIAGIAVPAIVIGIPVWAARKLHSRLERKPVSRYKKNAIIAGGVLLSFVVSPIISAVALAIGIPILLGYVYGVVPLSLCRSSGGCLSSNPSLENLQQEFQAARSVQARDEVSIDTAMSHKLGDPSIGETSLYMSNISLETNSIGRVTTVEREDRESASNAGLAGSIISATAEDANSTMALAGSLISKDSGYTLVPAEVHNSGGQVVVTAVVTTTNATNESTSPTKSPRSKSENRDHHKSLKV